MASLPLSSTRTRCAPVNTHQAPQNLSWARRCRAQRPHPQPCSSIGSGLPSLSKRWLTGAVALSHRSLAKRGGFRNVSIRSTRSRRFVDAIQCGLGIGRVAVGPIAAAGRSGVEEGYGVPYLHEGGHAYFHFLCVTTP